MADDQRLNSIYDDDSECLDRAYVSRLNLTIAIYIIFVSICRRQRKNHVDPTDANDRKIDTSATCSK